MPSSLQSIQFLRFIAATLVVYSHAEIATSLYGAAAPSTSGQYLGNFGASGVHIFFVISGFIMVYTSFGKRNSNFAASVFFLKRLNRIYPIYWVYAAVYLIMHQLWLEPYRISILGALGSLLLLPAFSSLIIGPGWTLSYELYFYICFGVFMQLGLLRGLCSLTLLFVLLITLGLGLRPSDVNLRMIADSLILEFLFGSWIGYLFLNDWRPNRPLVALIVLLSFVLFAAGLVFGYHRLPSVITWGMPSALLVAGLLFMERSGSLPHFIKALSFLGDSSYSLYLLHILLIDIFLTVFLKSTSNPAWPNILICLSLTALSILVAHLFYKILERPLVTSLQAVINKYSP